jgi:hypothetical protein
METASRPCLFVGRPLTGACMVAWNSAEAPRAAVDISIYSRVDRAGQGKRICERTGRGIALVLEQEHVWAKAHQGLDLGMDVGAFVHKTLGHAFNLQPNRFVELGLVQWCPPLRKPIIQQRGALCVQHVTPLSHAMGCAPAHPGNPRIHRTGACLILRNS